MKEIRDVIAKIGPGEPMAGVTTPAAEPDPGLCIPVCPVCGGLGYVRGDYPVGHPRFGKIDRCPNAPREIVPPEYYGLRPSEVTLRWADVRRLNNVEAAVRAVKETLDAGRGWVYLWGRPGMAKSLILKIAIAESLGWSRPGSYVRMAEIMDNLRGAFDPRLQSDESQRRLDRWASLPLLAIDEIDRVRATEYVQERQFLILDRRYEEAITGQSITIMASNAGPETLDDYLHSRVTDGRFRVVRLEGDDVRQMMDWTV